MSKRVYVKKDFAGGISTSVKAVGTNDIPNLGQIQEVIAGTVSVHEGIEYVVSDNFDISSGFTVPTEVVSRLTVHDRVLVTGQTDPVENGLYEITSYTSATRKAYVSRSADAPDGKELAFYTGVYVLNGENKGKAYRLLNSSSSEDTGIVVGTDGETWEVYSSEVNADDVQVDVSEFPNMSGDEDLQEIVNSFLAPTVMTMGIPTTEPRVVAYTSPTGRPRIDIWVNDVLATSDFGVSFDSNVLSIENNTSSVVNATIVISG